MANDTFSVETDESFAGGGSLPDRPFPTTVVQWRPSPTVSIDDITTRLRRGDPCVLARIKDDAILLDVRTISELEYDELIAAVTQVRVDGKSRAS